MPDLRQKLGIGTVQFGADYGISNKTGQTPPDEVKKILQTAKAQGLTIIDTAAQYGNSEEVLGSAIENKDAFKIVTKTIPLKGADVNADTIGMVKDGFLRSLKRLGTDRLYGLMFHHADDILSGNGESLYQEAIHFKDRGLVKKIGFSAYTQEQVEDALSRYPVDIVQIPLNVFDQRLVKSGTLKELKSRNIEVHVRSAFLQGIVFMKPEELTGKVAGLSGALTDFYKLCQHLKITPAQGALGYVLVQPDVTAAVCGINTDAQFRELCKAAETLPDLPKDCFDKLAVDQADLVNPVLWA